MTLDRDHTMLLAVRRLDLLWSMTSYDEESRADVVALLDLLPLLNDRNLHSVVCLLFRPLLKPEETT